MDLSTFQFWNCQTCIEPGYGGKGLGNNNKLPMVPYKALPFRDQRHLGRMFTQSLAKWATKTELDSLVEIL